MSSEEIVQQFVLCKINKSKNSYIAEETGILLKLSKDIEKDYRSIFSEEGIKKCSTFEHLTLIAKDMEKDMNWGRLITLYTFVGTIAVIHKDNEVKIEKLINWLSCCSNTWINDNGGWNEFMKRYGQQQQQQHSTNYFLYFLVPPCIYFIGKCLIKFL